MFSAVLFASSHQHRRHTLRLSSLSRDISTESKHQVKTTNLTERLFKFQPNEKNKQNKQNTKQNNYIRIQYCLLIYKIYKKAA